ncbi:acyl-ACP--UDP-N-acetylglucosamine O-acyltransferase [Methylophilaceae bacterium]|nr:acyl-ACP--UDP-N-acetylglucosamine O-acyltransferase [Methylophilaceae bacterium]|tara:strand:+ start:1064 stop:1849 length:786 start_codon:yes stop_codon:yes gene_type:complete
MEFNQKIHSTALIHPKSKLHPTVKVGAYSVVGENVQIDEGSEIGNFVTLAGNTTIGKDNKIYHYCSLGEIPQDKKFDNEKTFLSIGDGNTIREFCTFNVGTIGGGGITKIGNNNWLMAYVHIAHDCKLQNNIILANNTSLAGHVEIDDFAILGGFTLVHQFCKIGAHIITSVGTIILKDIPPFIIAAGTNAKPNGINLEGLKRRNFTTQSISDIKKAYKVIYREGNTIETANKILVKLAKKTKEVNLFVDFIDKSNRGLIR